MRLGLHLKFTLLMVTLAIAPVALVGYGLVAINQRGVQASVLELHTKLASKLAEGIQDRLRGAGEEIVLVSRALQRESSFEEKQDFLRFLVESDAAIRAVSVLTGDGKEFLKVTGGDWDGPVELVSHAQAPGFQTMRKEGRRNVSHARSGQRLGLQFYLPMAGGLALHVDYSLADLARRFNAESIGGTGFAMLVDASGEPVLYPTARLPAEAAQKVRTLPIVRQAVRTLSTGSSEYVDPFGEVQVGAYAPVPELGAAVITQQRREDAYEAVNWLRRRAFWVLLVAALLAFGVAYLTADRLVQPILAITRGAEAVAEGDFSQSVHLSTRDELEALARTFNRMTGRLKEYTELHVEQLVEEQEKTEAILFSIDDGIFMTDYEGRIQLANRAGKKLLGRQEGESLAGEALTDLLPDPAIREVLDEVQKNPLAHFIKEIQLTTGMARRTYQVYSEPVVSPKRGRTLGFVTALHDVTLEKEIEKVKDEFVHSITHDLRNPMTAIRGFVRFLLNELGGPLTPAQRKMVESMDKASFRLLSMINNILDVAKIDSGKMAIKVKPISLKEIAGRVMEIMMPLSIHRKITLRMASEDPGLMVGDEDLVERAFSNLVGNAIKFTPEGGAITITLQSDPDYVLASVEDTGEGIPSHYLKKLFEKYQQVEEQRRGGTGLGLAICKYIVESHLGKIWVESQFGKGSKFVFTLPRNLVQDADGEVRISAKTKSS